jgi:hypothetical protein
MKTAVQELMQWMEETEFMVNKGFIDKVHECLEKEKEQIIKAHGLKYYDLNEETISGEQYYNETYDRTTDTE